MSPSHCDGPSGGSDELPSSISSTRLERFPQVAAQSSMSPVLDCLDALDYALQKVNEESYSCPGSERMRLKATGAVRCKWPGREGDRGPLEETALQSVALLKAQLVQQMDQHPWLREAIHGDDLLHMVQGIAGQGPFKREDESLREAIRMYVGETLEQIYKDEEEARAFFKGQRDKEQRLCGRVREISEELSSDQFLHNRAGAEELRAQVSLQLLSHFLAKAKVAAKRGSHIEEVLSKKLAHFDAWNSEEEQSYLESEAAELSEEGKLQEQLAQLQEFARRHVEEHGESMERLEAEDGADADELRALRMKLEAQLKTVGRIAMRHQRRSLQRSEKERLFRYVQVALQDQEAMLRSQLDLSHLLVQRWQRGRQLHGQFVDLIRKAYDAMQRTAKAKTEEFHRELQLESAKFAALARATDGDLLQQRNKMLVALQKTFVTAKKQEEELEILERSFRPEAQTQTAQNAFRESQECVKRQEEQVEALSRLRETVAGKCEEYEETLRDFFQDEDAAAVSLHAWNEEAEAWLQGFFFTVRRSRLQMPQALCCDVMVVDTWTELGGSDQSLRHAASDPTIGTNFAGTGHTDLLAIRDGSATPCSGASAWSEGEVEALGRIEDIDT